MRGRTLKSLRLVVAMLLSTRSSKCFSPCTRMRVYTRHRGDLPNRPYRFFTPASSTRDTRTHRFLDVCFLVVAGRMLHCAQFLPHLPSSTTVPLSPTRRHPRSRTLMQRAMQLPRRRLLLFPFFQFGWGAGSERATHSPIPFYFLAAFAPTLAPSPSTLLLAPPPQVAGRRKNIYIYLFLRGLRLPTPSSSLAIPCYPPLRNTILRHHLRDSLCLTYFLFLSHCFFLLLTSIHHFLPRRRASARRPEREREGEEETDGDRS